MRMVSFDEVGAPLGLVIRSVGGAAPSSISRRLDPPS